MTDTHMDCNEPAHILTTCGQQKQAVSPGYIYMDSSTAKINLLNNTRVSTVQEHSIYMLECVVGFICIVFNNLFHDLEIWEGRSVVTPVILLLSNNS